MISFPRAHDRREVFLNTDRIVSMVESDSYGVNTTITTDDGKLHAVGMRAADVAKKINDAVSETSA